MSHIRCYMHLTYQKPHMSAGVHLIEENEHCTMRFLCEVENRLGFVEHSNDLMLLGDSVYIQSQQGDTQPFA